MDHLKKTVGTFSTLYRDTHAPSTQKEAIEQLSQRNKYLDPSHIKARGSRIHYERILMDGLFYAIVDTEVMIGGKRGTRWLIFDTVGNTVWTSDRTPNQSVRAAEAELDNWIDEHLTEALAIETYARHADRLKQQAIDDLRKLTQAADALESMGNIKTLQRAK